MVKMQLAYFKSCQKSKDVKIYDPINEILERVSNVESSNNSSTTIKLACANSPELLKSLNTSSAMKTQVIIHFIISL